MSACTPEGEAGHTAISLQPGGQGRAWGLSPTGCHCAMYFQEAHSPCLGPVAGAGLPPGREGCPHLLQAGPCATQGGGLFPQRCLGQKTQSAVCLLSSLWVEALVKAGQQGWGRAPRIFAGPQPCLSRWEKRTSEATESHLFFMQLPACHLLRVPLPLGPPLAFQDLPIPSHALTSDHGDLGHHFSTLLLCREGN